MATENLEDFETAYITYMANLKHQEKLHDSLVMAKARLDFSTASLKKDIADLSKMCWTSVNKIDSLKQPVNDAKAAVLSQYAAIKDTITNDFELSLPQLVSAATSIAFSPEMPMQAVQAVNVLYEGSTSVPDVSGVPQRKELIVNKLSTGLANISTFTTAAAYETDGTVVKADGEICAKLLIDKKAVEDFVKEFATSNFAKAGTDLLEKLQKFINLVTSRNTAIVEFNVYVSMINEKMAIEAKNAKEGEQVDADKATYTDTEIQSMAAWMETSYQQARQAYMKILAQMQLAIQYRWLIYDDLLLVPADALHPDTKSLKQTYNAPQAMTSLTLKTLRAAVEANFRGALDAWQGRPDPFRNAKWKLPPGTRDALLAAVAKAQLQRGKTPPAADIPEIKVPFQIPLPSPKNPDPFGQTCNVRLHRTKLIFDDLALAPGVDEALFTARLTQSTPPHQPEIIQDRRGNSHEFYHEDIVRVYKFNVKRIEDPQGGTDDAFAVTDILGGDVVVDFDSDEVTLDWMLPGPFATWTLDLSGTDVAQFDFIPESDVWLVFTGTAYATLPVEH